MPGNVPYRHFSMTGLLARIRMLFDGVPSSARSHGMNLDRCRKPGLAVLHFDCSSLLQFGRKARDRNVRPEIARELLSHFGIRRPPSIAGMRGRLDRTGLQP